RSGLCRSDLSGCSLCRSSLSRSGLCRSSLSGCSLSGCSLSGCSLCRSSLSGCSLCRSSLSGCSLCRRCHRSQVDVAHEVVGREVAARHRERVNLLLGAVRAFDDQRSGMHEPCGLACDDLTLAGGDGHRGDLPLRVGLGAGLRPDDVYRGDIAGVHASLVTVDLDRDVAAVAQAGADLGAVNDPELRGEDHAAYLLAAAKRHGAIQSRPHVLLCQGPGRDQADQQGDRRKRSRGAHLTHLTWLRCAAESCYFQGAGGGAGRSDAVSAVSARRVSRRRPQGAGAYARPAAREPLPRW
ncbi:MAG TPA: hypothetical protein DEP45_02325, partial [Armatimonadetes bacterium]|nr:hypothetical protein [Armatimonadota bacterium]